MRVSRRMQRDIDKTVSSPTSQVSGLSAQLEATKNFFDRAELFVTVSEISWFVVSDRGRLARNATQGANSLLEVTTISHCHAHCGRDARDPMIIRSTR